MEESEKWRNFLCILKVSKTEKSLSACESCKQVHPFDCKLHDGQDCFLFIFRLRQRTWHLAYYQCLLIY